MLSADVVSGDGASDGGSTFFAMMLCASMRAFFCASRAILVFSAIALPAATRFGFFCFVNLLCCIRISHGVFLLNKLYLIEELLGNVH